MNLPRIFTRAASSVAIATCLLHVSVSAAITSGLVGHWTLDESDPENLQVVNSAPHPQAEDGTRTATIEVGQPSPMGSAYSFDGVTNNDFVSLGEAIVDRLRATDEFTLSGWINPAFLRAGSGTASRQLIVGANNQFQFGLVDEGGFFYSFIGDGSLRTFSFTSGPGISAGEFVHVVLVHERDPQFGDNVVRVYVNGTEKGEDYYYPAISNFSISGNILHLGRFQGNTEQDFDGLMSDFGLWTGRVLTPQEIAVVGGAGRAGVNLASSAVDDVLALYQSQSGTVTTGDWEWSYTTSFGTPSDGSSLALGKHYYGSDDRIYVVLGGSSGSWQGVMAEGGEPFSMPLVIVQQPADQEVNQGQTATFEVVVNGDSLEYQWFFRSPGLPPVAIEGADSSVLVINDVQLEDRGTYYCVISVTGSEISGVTREARLTILDAPALVGHWKLDESNPHSLVVTNSAPGVLRHGERSATTGINRFGIVGGAYDFTDGTAGVDTKYNAWVPATGDFSKFVWVKTSHSHPAAAGQGHLFSNNDGSVGRTSLHIQDGTVRFFIGGSPNLSMNNSGTNVANGEWRHIGITRVGTEFNIWVDGVKGPSQFSSNAVAQNANWALGRRGQAAGGFPFNGMLDDAGIWHRALTAKEISVMGGLGRIGVSLADEAAVEAIVAIYDAGTGTVQTGDWEWSRTTSFAPPASGASMVLGRHYYGDDGNIYVVLGGSAGSWQGVVASGGELADNPPIIVTKQPENQFTVQGGSAEFSVEVQADGPVTYEWFYRSGGGAAAEPVPGGDGSTLVLQDLQFEDAGRYFCRISQVSGSFWVESDEATLTFLDRPVNLVHHWLLDERAQDLPRLDPAYTPAEERETEGALANQVAGGHDAIFVKGDSVEDPAPRFEAASPSPYSSGSIGPNSREAWVALGPIAPENDAFSIAFWFKHDSSVNADGLSTQLHVLQSNSGGSQPGRWNLQIQNVNLTNKTFNLSLFHNPASTLTITTGLPSDEWHHFAMTRDDLDNFKIFVNGEERHNAVNSNPFTNAPGGVFLGNDPHRADQDFDRAFPGLFDDFRMYDGALSQSQVLGLMELGVFELNIVAHPEDTSVNLGETAQFNVTVQADGPVDYQWFLQRASGLAPEEIAGAESATLTVSDVTLADRGVYYVVVTERGGETTATSLTGRLNIADEPALVAHWKLNETDDGSLVAVNSAPGAVVHGQRTPDAVIDEPGIVDGAYLFADGAFINTMSNDWVPATGDFSMFAWVKTNSSHSTQGHVLSNNQTGPGRSSLHVQSGTARYFLGGPPSNLSLTSITSVTDGRWHHIGVTRSGNNFTLWVNGAPEVTGTSSVAVQYGPEWAIAMNWHQTNAYPFNGSVDDVGIWRKALSPQEVAVIGGLGRVGLPLSSEAEVAAVVAVFQAQSGSAVTGAWQWNYTSALAPAADGAALRVGRHYVGDDDQIYIVLGGSEDAWEGVVASSAEPVAGYEDWVAANFLPGERENEEISGPHATPAGDGVPNLLKYAFGMEAKEPAPRDELPFVALGEDGLTLTYTRLTNATDIAYVIEISTDLVVWDSGAELVEEIDVEDRGDTQRVTVKATTLPGEHGRGFIRVQVVLLGS